MGIRDDNDVYDKSIWKPFRFQRWLESEGHEDVVNDHPNWIVYFISDGEFVKIGVTNNIKERLSDLQVGNARKLTVMLEIWVVSKKAAHEVEWKLHSLFSDYLMNGEWFDIQDKLIWKLWLMYYKTYESEGVTT